MSLLKPFKKLRKLRYTKAKKKSNIFFHEETARRETFVEKWIVCFIIVFFFFNHAHAALTCPVCTHVDVASDQKYGNVFCTSLICSFVCSKLNFQVWCGLVYLHVNLSQITLILMQFILGKKKMFSVVILKWKNIKKPHFLVQLNASWQCYIT